jgi:hypothetical protein
LRIAITSPLHYADWYSEEVMKKGDRLDQLKRRITQCTELLKDEVSNANCSICSFEKAQPSTEEKEQRSRSPKRERALPSGSKKERREPEPEGAFDELDRFLDSL